jgi:hypothetical protein
MSIWLFFSVNFIKYRSLADNGEKVDPHACADFNHGSAQAALAGLANAYICPNDHIARVKCNESFPN